MALNQKLKIENSKCKRFEYEGGFTVMELPF